MFIIIHDQKRKKFSHPIFLTKDSYTGELLAISLLSLNFKMFTVIFSSDYSYCKIIQKTRKEKSCQLQHLILLDFS